jgi:hypothetical protein
MAVILDIIFLPPYTDFRNYLEGIQAVFLQQFEEKYNIYPNIYDLNDAEMESI